MTTLIVASSEPRVGRSTVAAAMAYRIGRAGKPVTLARLAGDDSAEADAATFGSLEYIIAAPNPVAAGDIASLARDVVVEAPPGSVKQLASLPDARILAVGTASSPRLDAPKELLAGTVLTKVPSAQVAGVSSRAGTLAVLVEDRALAAPAVVDIARAIEAEWLIEGGQRNSIERVMISPIASDSAEPYFRTEEPTCIITRVEKSDLQLAALYTNVQALVLAGEGDVFPYTVDRIAHMGDEVALLRSKFSTVETMRRIEGLYGLSRFDGQGKVDRAVELLDEANAPVEF